MIRVIIFIVILSFTSPQISRADTVEQFTEIQKKLKSVWKNINDSQREEKAVRSSIEKINDKIGKREKEMRQYDRRISQTNSEISGLSNEVDTLTAELDSRKGHLKEYVRYLYKQQYGGNALILMSATDFSDLENRSKYISLLATYESSVINKYTSDIQTIHSKKRELESMVDGLNTSKEEAALRTKELQGDLAKKDQLLSKIRETKASYEKRIKELEGSSQRLQGMIQTTEKKNIPGAILGNGFVSSRGKLPWPVNGKVLIPFGQYKDPDFNITVNKNGIEIGAEPGDTAKSVAGGRVIYCSPFEGYGMLVIIDHGGGYHSVYGNLSEISIAKDDLLIKGMDLGAITKSKFLNAPALYFEIRHNGKPVNPVEWLERQG